MKTNENLLSLEVMITKLNVLNSKIVLSVNGY